MKTRIGRSLISFFLISGLACNLMAMQPDVPAQSVSLATKDTHVLDRFGASIRGLLRSITGKRTLSFDEVQTLLNRAKAEYAKKLAPEQREMSRNKGTVLRIINKNLIPMIIITVLLCVILRPIGEALKAGQGYCNSTALNQSLEKAYCYTLGSSDFVEIFKYARSWLPATIVFELFAVIGVITAKIYSLSPTPAERIKDVIGLDDQTAERIERYIDMFRNPAKYKKYGAVLPRGLLLIGPPGTGKSMIAKAIAGTTRKNYYDAPAPSFNSPDKVAEKFKDARKTSPSVIFIDEIDAIGAIDRSRQSSDSGDLLAVKILNQLLIELQSAENNQIIVIAATNYPHILNPSLVRSGRFDEVIVIPQPDFVARIGLLINYIFKNKTINADAITTKLIIDLAERTDGFTASDFEAMVNHAALTAARSSSAKITAEHLHAGLEILETNKSALVKKYC